MVTIVVAGFALVALPLLVAVVGGAMYVDRLAARGEELVRDSVALAREGQALQGRLAQMERNARQYRILGDASLVALYRERHAAFIESLAALDRGSLALEAAIKRRRLRRIAADVETVMGDAGPNSGARRARGAGGDLGACPCVFALAGGRAGPGDARPGRGAQLADPAPHSAFGARHP
ncbi:MAG: hypothetical protein BRD57_00725 [Proteobacteria bacterium SW_6_67_9]|nr:MAG: hypothetical protein BRD57_00725 [Proteobacteria bacterium SW_6_67_9]